MNVTVLFVNGLGGMNLPAAGAGENQVFGLSLASLSSTLIQNGVSTIGQTGQSENLGSGSFALTTQITGNSAINITNANNVVPADESADVPCQYRYRLRAASLQVTPGNSQLRCRLGPRQNFVEFCSQQQISKPRFGANALEGRRNHVP